VGLLVYIQTTPSSPTHTNTLFCTTLYDERESSHREVWCSRQQESYDYIMDWLAGTVCGVKHKAALYLESLEQVREANWKNSPINSLTSQYTMRKAIEWHNTSQSLCEVTFGTLRRTRPTSEASSRR